MYKKNNTIFEGYYPKKASKKIKVPARPKNIPKELSNTAFRNYLETGVFKKKTKTVQESKIEALFLAYIKETIFKTK